MEDWNEYKTEFSPFTNYWLLKEKLHINPEKKVYVKPFVIPETNASFTQNLEYFLQNFNYPNYSILEFMNSNFSTKI